MGVASYVFWISIKQKNAKKKNDARGIGIGDGAGGCGGETEHVQEIRLGIVRRIYGAGVQPSITLACAKDNFVSRCHLYGCPHKLILNKTPLLPS